jgi:hypothetical protein
MGFSRFPSQLFGVASAQLPSIHGGATFFYTSKPTLNGYNNIDKVSEMRGTNLMQARPLSIVFKRAGQSTKKRSGERPFKWG